MGIVVPRDDPAFKHSGAFVRTDVISTRNAKVGFLQDESTKVFIQRSNLSTGASSGLGLLGDTEQCKSKFLKMLVAPFQLFLAMLGTDSKADSEGGTCDPQSPYRTMDGVCNNLQDPMKGAAFRRFNRILLPDYYEGVSRLRRDVNGDPLPSARLVSTSVNRMTVTPDDTDFSALHMTFGQFLDHDITRTPVIKLQQLEMGMSTNEELPVKCCDPRLKDMEGKMEDLGCAPIDIPEDDPFYSNFNQTCMEFVRSSPAPRCSLGPREQMNEQSAYLDASQIYGVKPTIPVSDPLRSYYDGLLENHEISEDYKLLSLSMNIDDGCNMLENMAQGKFCFRAGDGRVNEILPLTFFHVVWLREHNRVAKILKELRPGAGDEELYQESKRIVSAQLQHITYNEFLPTIIPFPVLEAHGLLPQTGPTQSSSYNPTFDATIANSFATASFRFGHSEIRDFVKNVKTDGNVMEHELSSFFFNPFELYNRSCMGDVARGSISSNSKKVDQFFSPEVAGKLFRGNQSYGLDLLALNTQRGRDHGLPGYTKWLAKCGWPNINQFEDLSVVMPGESIEALRSVYKSVHDIDLYPGAISENHLDGGSLGPTFTCLLTDQFKSIKFGDRFWYEERGLAGSFTRAQMKELHQVSLARVMCNNIPELERVQRFPLMKPGPGNPVLSCLCPSSLIPAYDLTPWRT
ncbi:chorion peroxidase-like [Palaemon carinicauda]|uniref:chorion peroxidase-like n=1 Tax=Palaemon carinicauda TaxID=392227 RepID=UPI0035B5AFF2